MDGAALGVRTIEAVTLHELAHQWFYGLVGSNEYRWAFMDEGLTTWATLRAAEAKYGDGAALDGFGFKLSHTALTRARAAGGWANDTIAQRADAFGMGSDYGRLVYARTATLLETIGRVWSADALDAAMLAYAKNHRFKHPTPDDLITAIRTGVGKDAAAFLKTSLHDRGWVDLSVASFHNVKNESPEGIFGDPQNPTKAPKPDDPEAERRAVIKVRRKGTLVVPVDIEIRTEDGGVETIRWNGATPHYTYIWTGNSKVSAVIVDPEVKVLIDQDLSNNARRVSPSSFAPRVASHVGYLAQLLMSLTAP